MKSLVLVADGKPVLVLLRGDHQLSETKFAAVAAIPNSARRVRTRSSEWFGAEAGSLGPVGVNEHDRSWPTRRCEGRRNMIAGANRDDHHLRNVTLGEDFQAEIHDLRQVAAGDSLRRTAAARSRFRRRSRSATSSSWATSTPIRWGCAC